MTNKIPVKENSDLYKSNYDSKQRFISYWHQINEIKILTPKSVLEVGIGTGFVSHYLRNIGINLTTIDNDGKLNPDIVADVSALPFKDSSFEVVAAYEILEHMPYKKSLQALGELKRVSSSHIIISVPNAIPILRIELPLPKFGKFRRLYNRPFYSPRIHEPDPYSGHQWEIGKKGYPLGRITTDINKSGLKIEKNYRVFEVPYHHFFILKKAG